LNRRTRLGLIAYEYPPLVGGMATYARALARHMRDRGYDVHVFANREAVGEAGLTVHPILTTDLARDLPALARQDMDLWHSINFGYAPLAVLKRPFVLTVHGTDFLKPWVRFTMDRVPLLWRLAGLMASRTALRAVHLPSLRCVDHVFTCSRFSARLFRSRYPSVRRLTVVPNGVDKSLLTPLPMAGTSRRHARCLLTVCRLGHNPRKNVDGVLKALALLGDSLDLEYHVIGDGPGRPALEAMAARLGLAQRVRFLGRISDQALREAYASAALCVLVPRPERDDVEGFGIIYLEAAAAGTPSLGGRFGGAVDAIAEGQSGFFAADATPEAIAAALKAFFTGQVRFDEAAIRAHAARHTWPVVLQAVENVYERILAGRGAASRLRRQSSAKPATVSLRGDYLQKDEQFSCPPEDPPATRERTPRLPHRLETAHVSPPAHESDAWTPCLDGGS